MHQTGCPAATRRKALILETRESDQVFQLVYGELRRLADRYLHKERAGHTLQPTALVHEAYLRLVEQTGMPWGDRDRFLALVAQAMRRILVDHARRRLAAKRGGAVLKLSFEEGMESAEQQNGFVVAMHEALSKLAEFDPQQAQLVELRFFAGLTVEETAGVLGVSARTVNREWILAKGWLHREINKGA